MLDDVSKIVYGSPAQLKSSIINAGTRKLYFLDLPRTPGKEDSLYNVLSIIEDLKNGHIVSNMYGKAAELIMKPPHVIVFTNTECPLKALSSDRWRVFKIEQSSFTLKKI